MRKELFRFAALTAMLLAGSCAAPGTDDGNPHFADPTANHPIVVQPESRAVRVYYGGSGSLAPEDMAKLDRVVSDYEAGGSGSISISAPEGPDSSEAISYFGEKLVQMGVPRAKIMVGTHPTTDGDRRVEIGFIGYVAHTEPCGDWSEDVAMTDSNLPMPNFGCAVQHNIAAMVANPRDLDESRRLDDAPDATRRTAVIGHYERGEVSQATKKTVDSGVEQSAPGSGLGD